MYEWDSKDKINHWIKRDWPFRESLTPSYRNILYPALVDRSNVILPPLHIKLGLIKQLVKALNKEGACFKCIQEKFPWRRLKRVHLLHLKLENSPKTRSFYLPQQMWKKKHGFSLHK